MKEYQLWEGKVPFFDEQIDQPRPTLVAWPADQTGGPTAAVIVCPGGAYVGRAEDHEGRQICELLASNGISGYMLRYRVAPYHYPVELLDVQRAVRYLRYHAGELNLSPDRIGVLGFSAGGHLAVMALEQYDSGLPEGDAVDRVGCRPDLGVLGYPVVSLEAPWRHAYSAECLLGEHFKDEELLRRLSGENSVHDDAPPTFLWHTAEDSCVPVRNSLAMAAALGDKNIPFELHIFPAGNHGLGLAKETPGTSQWSALMIDWLHRNRF